MHPPRYLRQSLLACALFAALAACSSSSSSSSAAAPATTAASSAPASSPPAGTSASSPAAAATETATQKAIAANWTAFFDPKEPAAKRIALLEDGQQLAPALSGLAKSSTAAETTAKVVSVTVASATQAKVTYDILLSGTPALTNQSGTAILQDGTWKVSVGSFCALLTVQAAGNTKSLPAACKSAS